MQTISSNSFIILGSKKKSIDEMVGAWCFWLLVCELWVLQLLACADPEGGQEVETPTWKITKL